MKLWKAGMFSIAILYSLIGMANPNDQNTAVPHFVMGIMLPSISDEVNTADIKLSLEFWFEEISRELNVLDAKTVFYTSARSLHEAFKRKEIDMFIASPLDIVKFFDRRHLQDGIVGVTDNDNLNALTLLVNKNQVQTFEQLKDKRVLLPENDDLMKVFLDTLTLQHSGTESEKYFAGIRYKNKNSRLVLDLFFDQVDAVLVYRSFYDVMVELNPQIGQKITVLESYPLMSKNFAFFRADYPYIERIFPRIDDFSNSDRGRQVLDIFKSDRLIRAKVADLEPVARLYRLYLSLQQ